jgi:hypothetical protein
MHRRRKEELGKDKRQHCFYFTFTFLLKQVVFQQKGIPLYEFRKCNSETEHKRGIELMIGAVLK